MNYSEQLKDPRWKKRRAQVIIVAGMKCELCGHTNVNQLQVHHKIYKNGLMAWKYELKDLISLCRNCHYTVHKPMLIERKVEKTRIINIFNSMI